MTQSNQHLIFLHGNSSSADSFEAVKKLITDLPCQIHCLEFAGHGKTEGLKQYSYRQLFEDMLKEISQIDGEKLLVGHSLGGHVSIEIAEKVIDLKGLLIFGTPPIANPPNISEAFLPYDKMMLFATPNPNKTEVDALFKDILNDSASADLAKQAYLQTDPKFREGLARDLTSGKNPFQDEATIFGRLPIKKYVINGMKDPMINFSYLQQLQRKAETGFELIEMTESGHYPQLENPKIFAEYLRRIATEVFNNKL